MLTFTEREFLCSRMGEESQLPALSYEREPVSLKSTITDYEGLFIGFGGRETAYPYAEQNLYSDTEKQMLPVAVLENEYLCAEFLPSLGGRLWRLYDKKHGRDVVYANDAIRMRNLSVRNAWFAGGVEWNCGVIGHTPFTCAPMYTARLRDEEGADVLRFYEYERVRGLCYQMDFWLDRDRLMSCVRIENPHETVVPMYWWSNMATPEFPGGRVAVPADSAYNNSDGLGIKKSTIPVDREIDISYPENIPDTIDYFYDIPDTAEKFIANVDAAGYGLLQISSRRMRGRKLFSWGHREGADNWQAMLTGDTGKYIEIQVGIGKTQYECLPMPPKTSWSFVECYTLAHISPDAVDADYGTFVHAVQEQVDAIASTDALEEICRQKVQTLALQSGELIYSGSGFGYLAQRLGQSVPAHLAFTPGADVRPWMEFVQRGAFDAEPENYAYGPAMEALLANALGKCRDWAVPYQLALTAYDKRDFTRARELCEKSFVFDNNYRNNHLYAAILYQFGEPFAYFARKSIRQRSRCYSVAESNFRLLLKGECYAELIAAFDDLSAEVQAHPRVRMYLAMAYLKTGDINTAERILTQDGGLILFDFREGDRFLDTLYRSIRKQKYGEKSDEIQIPKQFDFIVTRSDGFEE